MKSSYNVVILDAAANDLHGLWHYIAVELKEPSSAAKLLDSLEKAILSLSENPERHNVLADKMLNQKGIRRVVVKNYLVFYVMDETSKTVNILRVLHGRQNWETII